MSQSENSHLVLIPHEELNLGPFDKEVLSLSFHWLNDPEIQYMTHGKPVEKEMQLEWYATLPSRKDFLIYSIRYRNLPIGVMGLKNLKNGEAEYWGYLGNKDYWGKGIGNWMMQQIINVAANKSLHRIYLRVLPDNKRAIKLYEKFGFKLIFINTPSLLLNMEIHIQNNLLK